MKERIIFFILISFLSDHPMSHLCDLLEFPWQWKGLGFPLSSATVIPRKLAALEYQRDIWILFRNMEDLIEACLPWKPVS